MRLPSKLKWTKDVRKGERRETGLVMGCHSTVHILKGPHGFHLSVAAEGQGGRHLPRSWFILAIPCVTLLPLPVLAACGKWVWSISLQVPGLPGCLTAEPNWVQLQEQAKLVSVLWVGGEEVLIYLTKQWHSFQQRPWPISETWFYSSYGHADKPSRAQSHWEAMDAVC